MDDWDEEAFIESIKNELWSLWKNKRFSKGDEVTSAARITVPAGFLQPISQKDAPLAVEQDEPVAPPRRRRRLLLELDDSSDEDGDGKSSPPCRDVFTNFSKKRRSRKNAFASVSTWKNICIPICCEDPSTDRRSCDRGPCCGDSVQLTELNSLIVAEISGHALRKERERAADNRIANASSTHNLYLGPTLEDLNKERTSRKNRFQAKSNQKKLKSAESRNSIGFEANSNKEDQDAVERICEGTEFGEKSDKENLGSAERRACKRMSRGANSEKENLESIERTCERRDLGASKLPTLDADNYKLLQEKLKEAEEENLILVNTIEEERRNSEQEKEILRKKLKDASYMIGELVMKIRMLEGMGGLE